MHSVNFRRLSDDGYVNMDLKVFMQSKAFGWPKYTEEPQSEIFPKFVKGDIGLCAQFLDSAPRKSSLSETFSYAQNITFIRIKTIQQKQFKRAKAYQQALASFHQLFCHDRAAFL